MSIYFVGIKGVGMTGLAIIAKEAGFNVGGSDEKEEFLTDVILEKNGIAVDIGFETSHLDSFFKNKKIEDTLVVTTAAHNGLLNPQCVFAKEKGIKVLTHGQAVGYFMKGTPFERNFEGVSILGCHGKTTISGMVATALSEAKLDPSYTVGTSELFPLGNPGKLGNGKYFVAEADEFISDVKEDRTVKFLYQYPNYAIINNIDFDHPDVYESILDVEKTFLKFCLDNIEENGTLIVNGDDREVLSIKNSVLSMRKDVKIITYGENEDNNIIISNFKEEGWGSEFDVTYQGTSLGKFNLSVPGYHNVKNSLSVIALMHDLGIDKEIIKKALSAFKGTKRRQEILGKTSNGALVIDDYAHHPDEIEKTISAIKNAYPEKKIACFFQPHTLSRTISLQNEFTGCFTQADYVVFLPIFTSKREGEVSYDQLYSSIKKSIQEKDVSIEFLPDERSREQLSCSPYFFPKNRQSVIKYVDSHFNSKEWVIAMLGAGDIYRIAYDIVKDHG